MTFDIITPLETFCDIKGYRFIYGQDEIVNFELSYNNLDKNQIVLVALFNIIPAYNLYGGIESYTFRGVLIYGRKSELVYDDDDNLVQDSESNLDELLIDKYKNRLKELTDLMIKDVAEFSCLNRLDVTGMELRYDVNKHNDNIDTVEASLTFRYEN